MFFIISLEDKQTKPAEIEEKAISSSGNILSPKPISQEKAEKIKQKTEEDQSPQEVGDAAITNIKENAQQEKETQIEGKDEESLTLNLQKKTDIVTEEVFKYLLEELGQGNEFLFNKEITNK